MQFYLRSSYTFFYAKFPIDLAPNGILFGATNQFMHYIFSSGCRQHLPTLGFIRENYTFTDFNLEAQSKLTYRQLPHPKENVRRRERVAVPQDFRFVQLQHVCFSACLYQIEGSRIFRRRTVRLKKKCNQI